jgi:glycosyltransferase involved in cell wall biosynthesis
MAKSIGITGFFRQDQRVGGVFSVYANLLSGFAELLETGSTADPFALTVFHGRVMPPCREERFHWRAVSDRLGRFAAEAQVAAGPASRLDALLFPNYHTPLVVRAPRAVTIIHDLLYVHMPELWTPAKRLWMRWCHEVTLRKCHRVVTISAAVKEDLLRLYGSRWDERVEVIWNPVSVDRFAGAREADVTAGRPYILCVSVDRPSKNLARLIRAFSLVRTKFPDHCLVLAGQLRSLWPHRRDRSPDADQNTPAAAELVERLELAQHVRVTGFISDEQLGGLYRGATMCVLPSLFEGFGMPAVESLAMGKPTLVSDLPVLREVTFNSAFYLDDPTDVNAMAEAIIAVLQRPEHFQPTAELAERVRDTFSPRQIARRYLKVLTA